MVLRKINGPKRDEVRRNWKRPHKEELHDQVWESELINSDFL
jgi:hypothetical protein